MTVSQDAWADVLMITYRRPHYLRRTLPHLLDSVDDRTRVWLWHNGDDEEVLDVIDAHRHHPRIHRVHHSHENVRLRPPTNWLWQEAEGELLGKVDDDCMIEPGWVDRLRQAHSRHDFGALGSWRFRPEDFRPDLVAPKIETFADDVTVLKSLWVQGSGYLVPRAVVDQVGLLSEGQSFTRWCLAVAKVGRVNGWLMPFIQEEHLDDPRSPMSALRSDQDLLDNLPLSAKAHGVTRLEDWASQMRRSAVVVQQSSLDPRDFDGWRSLRRRARRRIQRAMTGRSKW